jgi:L-iditol 2-dehydrogenase
MRALRATDPGPDHIELLDVARPGHLKEGEVTIATQAAGVCGSDVHVWHGTQTYPMKYPVTLGHEAAGVVTEVGGGVTNVSEGDRVVSETARLVCGSCFACREGRYNLCTQRLGFGALYDGMMADRFVTRADIIHVVPESVSDAVAAVTEPYCVAYNAVVERARVRPGDIVTVVGPGPIGIFSAQIALFAGASHVIVAGLPGDEPRLAVVESYGAVTLASDGPWWESPSHSGLSDVVVDASGLSATLAVALTLVRAGGQIVKVGWGPEPYDRPLDLLVAKAVEVHGAFSHTWSTWERVLRLLGQGRLSPCSALATYDFSSWQSGFSAMASRRAVKAVLVL